MINTVSFPGLGLSFEIDRVALRAGPFTVYWYGLIVTCGVILGIAYAVRRGKTAGLDPDRTLDVAMYSVLVAFIGARIYYVAFSWDYYRAHPEEIIRIWEGGIAFYGGVIAGVLFAMLMCRLRKVRFLRVADFLLTGTLLGQSIGRWGNFVNVEAFGSYCTGIQRMVSPHIDAYLHQNPSLLPGFTQEQVLSMTEIPVHPTFFYESAWLMLGFILLAAYTPRRKFDGELTLMYFVWNGLGRAWIEGLRTDSLMIGNYRVSQVLAAVMAVVSLLLLAAARSRCRKGTLPEALRIECWPPADEAGGEDPGTAAQKDGENGEKETEGEGDVNDGDFDRR